MTDQAAVKWYLRPAMVLIAILIAGPFAIPLVWMSPALRKRHKILISALLILLTIWLTKVSIEIYKSVVKEMGALSDLLK